MRIRACIAILALCAGAVLPVGCGSDDPLDRGTALSNVNESQALAEEIKKSVEGIETQKDTVKRTQKQLQESLSDIQKTANDFDERLKEIERSIAASDGQIEVLKTNLQKLNDHLAENKGQIQETGGVPLETAHRPWLLWTATAAGIFALLGVTWFLVHWLKAPARLGGHAAEPPTAYKSRDETTEFDSSPPFEQKSEYGSIRLFGSAKSAMEEERSVKAAKAESSTRTLVADEDDRGGDKPDTPGKD